MEKAWKHSGRGLGYGVGRCGRPGGGIGPGPHMAAVLGTARRSLASLLQAPTPQPPLPLRRAASSPEPLRWGGHGLRSLLPLPHLPCPTSGGPAAALSGQGGCWREPPGGLLELRSASPAQEWPRPERGAPCGQGLCWCSDLPSEPFFPREILLRLLLPLEKARLTF